MSRFLVLFIMLGIIFFSHFFIYRTVVRTFDLKGIWQQLCCTIMVFLSACFPFSLIALINRVESIALDKFYFFASFWMGFAINLLLASLLCRIILGLAKIIRLKVSFKCVGVACLVAAFVLQVFGTYKAFYPKVHKMDISIKNLSAKWEGKVVVQLSDVHLGIIYGPAFMERIVEKVNALNPELILITGDLFDAPGGDYESNIEVLRFLKAKQGVYMSVGNHEIYNEKAGGVFESIGFRILDSEVLKLEGLQLVGVPYPGLTGKYGKKVLENIRNDMNDDPSILLFHTPTDIYTGNGNGEDTHFNTYWGPDTSCRVNKKLGIDLQLSGHTHAGQIFPFGFLSRWIYKGRDFGLSKEDDFQLYVSSGTGTFGPPLRTAGRSEIVAITLSKA